MSKDKKPIDRLLRLVDSIYNQADIFRDKQRPAIRQVCKVRHVHAQSHKVVERLTFELKGFRCLACEGTRLYRYEVTYFGGIHGHAFKCAPASRSQFLSIGAKC